MIAVIADDFTGAAEIGGIGIRHGLNVIIETEPIQNHDVDLLIIATDTRSLPVKEASEQIAQLTAQLLEFSPRFIFKKIDSVLRGNVTEELMAQMKVSGKNRAVIIAANPVFKRVIRDGIYYIDNKPLNKTCFSSDPQCPIHTSSVMEILNTEQKKLLYNMKPDDELPEKGLIIGDVTCSDDLGKWARKDDPNTLFAGASGFFNALLESRQIKYLSKKNHYPSFGKRALFILGSTFPKETDFMEQFKTKGFYISNMPQEIYANSKFDPSALDNWVDDIEKGLNACKKVVISVIHSPSNEPGISLRIRNNIAELIKRVINKAKVNELLIEGGSTTSMVLKYLNIKKLYPIHEFDTGVIRMRVDNLPELYITTKPGSYSWPENVWISQNNQPTENITYE